MIYILYIIINFKVFLLSTTLCLGISQYRFSSIASEGNCGQSCTQFGGIWQHINKSIIM